MDGMIYDITPVSNLRNQLTIDTSPELRDLKSITYEFDAKTEVFTFDKITNKPQPPEIRIIKIVILGKPTKQVCDKIANKEPFRALLKQTGDDTFMMD